MGVYGGNVSFFVGTSWNFVSDDKRKVDTYHVSFNFEKTSNIKVIAIKAFDKLIWNEQ